MDNAKEHTPDPTTATAAATTATPSGVLSDNDTPPAERGHGLTKEAVERLGRERPPLLGSMVAEVGFVTAIVLSMMMSEFFISGFNIALPKVAEALSMPESLRTWPAAVINLTTASFLLPFSRLCDRYGPRLVFLGGHAWLTLWSLVCGFSADAVMLIVCRAMQGLGAAAFMPAGLALLARTYRPGPRKNLIFSLYGAFACIGFYFGILISAVSVGLLHWRWYFWIGTCLCLAVVVLGVCFVPRDLRADDPDVSMDWLGMATIAPGLVLVVFALTDGGHAPDGWRTPYIYVTFVAGALLLCAAVYVQGWVSEQPLLPAEVFRPKYLKRLMFGLFCAYGVFSLFLFYASFYIEEALRIKPMLTAAWFTPLAVGGMVLAITGGFIMHIIPGRLLMIISQVGFVLSVLLFALVPEQNKDGNGGPSTSFLYWAYVFPAMLCGTIGVDITFNITNVFITTAMPRRLQSAASGVINSLLYLGMAFWLGVGELAVSTAREHHRGGELPQREQYTIGFWTGTGLAGVALLIVVTVPMGKQEADLTPEEKAELEKEEAEACASQPISEAPTVLKDEAGRGDV